MIITIVVASIRLCLHVIKGKVIPVLCFNKHYAMKSYWGSGGIAPRILDLGTKWR